jgi:hypothetical protein
VLPDTFWYEPYTIPKCFCFCQEGRPQWFQPSSRCRKEIYDVVSQNRSCCTHARLLWKCPINIDLEGPCSGICHCIFGTITHSLSAGYRLTTSNRSLMPIPMLQPDRLVSCHADNHSDFATRTTLHTWSHLYLSLDPASPVPTGGDV